MKRKMTVVAGALAAAVRAVSLAGCFGGEDVKKAEEPVSASQAFNAKGVWFRSSDAPEKDEKVSEVFVFDGAGNVTVYKTDLTYGDLKGKSEDEIVDTAKQQDEEVFNATRDSRIDELNAEITNRTRDNADPQEGLNMLEEQKERYADDPEALAAMQAEREELQAEINENDEAIQRMKDEIAELEAGYTAPEAQPFTLRMETDGTGNNAESEDLGYGTESIELTTQSMGWTVYDFHFLGYKGLYTIIEQGHHGFILDTPGTEGVEVD